MISNYVDCEPIKGFYHSIKTTALLTRPLFLYYDINVLQLGNEASNLLSSYHNIFISFVPIKYSLTRKSLKHPIFVEHRKKRCCSSSRRAAKLNEV